MERYDGHLHTTYSIDGTSTVEEMCRVAIKRGLSGIAVTDHNIPVADRFSHYDNIRKSACAAREMDERLAGRLRVFAGVELADHLIMDYDAEPFYHMDLDCILGSIHSTPLFEKYFPDCPYGSDLKNTVDIADIDFLKRFLEIYYLELLKVAEKADVDVMTHLTFPLRYINGRAKRGIDIRDYYPQIDAILAAIIKTDKALEVNTSGLLTDWGQLMPNQEILTNYFNMGGRVISIGSDAHKKEAVGAGIDEAIVILKQIGFETGAYYIKRKRFLYTL